MLPRLLGDGTACFYFTLTQSKKAGDNLAALKVASCSQKWRGHSGEMAVPTVQKQCLNAQKRAGKNPEMSAHLQGTHNNNNKRMGLYLNLILC